MTGRRFFLSEWGALENLAEWRRAPMGVFSLTFLCLLSAGSYDPHSRCGYVHVLSTCCVPAMC